MERSSEEPLLLFFCLEVITVHLGQFRRVIHNHPPLFDNGIGVDALVAGDQQVELIDAVVTAVVAGFALLLGPVLQRHFLSFWHVSFRQLGHVVQ